MDNDSIKALKEALEHSPNNIPLRLHLAHSLLGLLAYEEAEKEFKKILSLDATQQKAKLGLATIYFRKEEYKTAVVILEEIIEESPEESYQLLYCKALLRSGNTKEAGEVYRDIVQYNPALKDEELDVLGEMISNLYGALEVHKMTQEGMAKKEALNSFMKRVLGSIDT